jgi:hypothetical protein
MSNYTKNTNFTAKDNLTSGDPAKVIKGAEFDTEFNAIQTAVNSKADSNNSQLTGSTAAQAITTTGDVTVGGNLSVTGNATVAGNLTFGDAATDTVSFSADIDSSIIPETDNAYDLGSSTQQWRNLYVDGTANIDSLVADTADINGGTIDGVSISGTTASFSGEISANGGIALGDSDKATFGASDDLQIYHSGSHSVIQDLGTGNLYIDASDLYLRDSSGWNYASFTDSGNGGTATLFHNNSAKLTTTSTGVDVTGTVSADGLTVDGDAKIFSTEVPTLNNDTHAGETLFLRSGNSAGLNNVQAVLAFGKADGGSQRTGSAIASVQTDSDADKVGIQLYRSSSSASSQTMVKGFQLSHNGDIQFYENTGTTPKLTWDASAESLGIGTASPSAKLTIQTGGDEGIRLYRTGTNANFGGIEFRNSDDTATNGRLGWNANELRVEGTDKISFTTSSSEAMRIDSSGNVGIGTTSPVDKLHIYSLADGFKVGTSNNFTTVGWNNSSGYAEFGSKGVSDWPILFKQNNTEAMRIDSSGNLLVGMTSSSISNDGFAANASGYVSIADTNFSPLLLNRKGNDGTIIDLKKDGSTVGSIGTVVGFPIIGKNNTGIIFDTASNGVYPQSVGGANQDGVTNLGNSLSRWKDLYLSGGVYLGGTGSANKLDDYEEGTWTPVLKFDGSDTGITYNASYRTCTYTKVGRVVTLRVGIYLTSKGTATGNATIEGLPFAVKSLSYRDATCVMGYGSMTGLSTAGLVGVGRNGSTVLDLRQNSDSAVQIVNDAKFGNNTFMYATFVYDTDA